jgi:small-conductance mechanosensitive channel
MQVKQWKENFGFGDDTKTEQQRLAELNRGWAEVNKALQEAEQAGQQVAGAFMGESPGEKFLRDLERMRQELDTVGGIGPEPQDAEEMRMMAEQQKRLADEAERKAEAEKQAAEALKQQKKLQSDIERFREGLKAPAEKQMDELMKISSWFDQGLITLDEYSKAWEGMFDTMSKDFPTKTVEINYKINAPTEGEAFGSAESLRNLYTSRLGTGAPVSSVSDINFAPGQEEAVLKGIGGGKSKTDELLDSINTSIDQVAINTKALAQDPGRVKVAGSF